MGLKVSEALCTGILEIRFFMLENFQGPTRDAQEIDMKAFLNCLWSYDQEYLKFVLYARLASSRDFKNFCGGSDFLGAILGFPEFFSKNFLVLFPIREMC